MRLANPDQYINANEIRIPIGDGHPLNLIMAQAPLENTSEVFWQMVFEKKCCAIAMLTAEFEMGRSKSHAYWPKAVGDTMSLGRFSIKSLDIVNEDPFVASLLSITDIETGEVCALPFFCCFIATRNLSQRHKLAHLHVRRWLDHDVPSAEDMLTLVKNIVRIRGGSADPVLVHCSAGVGRSGP